MSALDVELEISGMTCASCATRIERKLNKLPGVEATVNYATEKARVRANGVETAELIAAVESAGYSAAVPAPIAPEPTSTDTAAEDPELVSLRRRLLISTALAVPVALMSMIPLLQFTYWQWLALTLTAPVAVWGAWPFHRAAFVNARHGAATMDTLISVGVIAAFGWSLAQDAPRSGRDAGTGGTAAAGRSGGRSGARRHCRRAPGQRRRPRARGAHAAHVAGSLVRQAGAVAGVGVAGLSSHRRPAGKIAR